MGGRGGIDLVKSEPTPALASVNFQIKQEPGCLNVSMTSSECTTQSVNKTAFGCEASNRGKAVS